MTTSYIESRLPEGVAVVRVMPNTPALVDEGIAALWLAAPVVGDPVEDARAVLDALAAAGVRPDGVLTFWENCVDVCARVAEALGLPCNPVRAVDAARSKVRTRELSAELGLPSPRAQRVREVQFIAGVLEQVR